MKPKRKKIVSSNRSRGQIKNYCDYDDLRNDDLSLKAPSELPYEVYIKSAYWQLLRRKVLQRDCNQCIVCNEDADQVHHRSYDADVLEGKCDKMLVSLCGLCHDFIEYYPDQSKRSDLKLKDEILIEMLESRGKSIKDHEAVPLSLTVEYKERRNTLNITISKNNNSDHPITLLLMKVLNRFRGQYRDDIRVPLPIGYDQFDQKSGKTIHDLSTNKPIMKLFHIDGKAVIKTTKYFKYDLKNEMRDILGDQEFGEVVFHE